MEIELVRKIFTDKSTIGNFIIDGKFECYVLEDVTRDPFIKIPKVTAIPYGRYKVTIDYSNRFKKDMPHILDVPEFAGIRIHGGNTDKDTEGCPLLGGAYSKDWIGGSRDAFNSFFNKLKKVIDNNEKVFITVRRDLSTKEKTI